MEENKYAHLEEMTEEQLKEYSEFLGKILEREEYPNDGI